MLGLPESFRCERNFYAIFLVVESYKVTKRRRLVPSCEKVMLPFLHEIYFKYFHIFNENSKKTRVTFFSDPMVQHLWEMFRTRSPESFKECVTAMQTQPLGAERLERFHEDLQFLENNTKIAIMPDAL